MVREKAFRYLSADGVHQCHAFQWLPEGQPRGVVQIVHGLADYIGRYAPFARYLADHGFVVVGEDHLGHGNTANGSKYGYFGPRDGWFLVARDVRRLRELAGKQWPNLPYFLLGHSMGSFLTRTYLIQWPGTVSGAILSGTGQEPPAIVAMGKAVCSLLCRLRGPDSQSKLIYDLFLGFYNRQFQPSRTAADWICRDEGVVNTSLNDPLCNFLPTVGMFRDIMVGLQFISNSENLQKMDNNTPIYLFSGAQDPVGQNGAGVRKVYGFFREIGCPDVTLKLYPGGRHEMLNEINKDEVWADTLAWLEGKL